MSIKKPNLGKSEWWKFLLVFLGIVGFIFWYTEGWK